MRSREKFKSDLEEKINRIYEITQAIYCPWTEAIPTLEKNFLYSTIFKDVSLNELDLKKDISKKEAVKELAKKVETGELFFEEVASIYEHAKLDIPLVIVGETGTGKELMTKAIHEISNRKNRSLVSFNAAAISSEVVESELFGYLKDSHSMATADKTGIIETAHMSTLFIDELGKMPMYLQHKLLRYLETREILPLGAAEPRIIDARIIAAIQPDELEDDKSILPDLKYRLGYPDVIYMPSLGDLIEDYGNNIIDISFVRIWEKMNIGHSGDYLTINERCYTLLRNRIFKGNFRELENILRGAIISTFAKQTDEIQPEDLPISNPSEREPTDCMQENSLYGNIPEFEKLKLSEICEFAENESAKWMKYIVREKVHHALNQHGNLRSALKSEGRHSNKEYQKCRDDIMRLTGMKVNEIKAV